LPGSNLIGQLVYESSLANSGFTILAILRKERNFYPYKNSHFEENDLVIVKGNVKDLMAIKDKNGINIVADLLWASGDNDKKSDLQLREVLVPVNSELNGRTVKSADFRNRFGLVVVAINRSGHNFSQKIGSIELKGGDLLLVQGTPERFVNLHDKHDLIHLDEHQVQPKRVKEGFAAIALFVVAIVLSSLKVLPVDIAFLSAALGTVLLGIIQPAEAYHKIDWRMLVLIAGMSAFGTAMKNSGADAFLARHVVLLFEGFGPSGIMLGFMLITVLLTQPMSNAASALVVLPIALQSAEQLQVSPLTFGIAVMLSASVSIITPFEPSCILIYGPGKYRFMDFIKVGGPLTLLLMAVIYFLVPLFFPLNT
jgi:di/tricarboxylate transporter